MDYKLVCFTHTNFITSACFNYITGRWITKNVYIMYVYFKMPLKVVLNKKDVYLCM